MAARKRMAASRPVPRWLGRRLSGAVLAATLAGAAPLAGAHLWHREGLHAALVGADEAPGGLKRVVIARLDRAISHHSGRCPGRAGT